MMLAFSIAMLAAFCIGFGCGVGCGLDLAGRTFGPAKLPRAHLLADIRPALKRSRK